MTTRHKRTRRHGLTAYKFHELMTGLIDFPVRGYDGYGEPNGEKVERTLRDTDDLMTYERALCPQHSRTKRYASVAPFTDDAMRADWNAHRDGLLLWWTSGGYSTSDRLQAAGVDIRISPGMFFRGWAGTRPWAWWTFDAPEPLPEGESELAFLERHELLFEGERAMRAEQEK